MPHPDPHPEFLSGWVCYRSVPAVANDLILVELDGGPCSPFSLPFSLHFDQGLGGISSSVCPMILRMLILRSGKDFIDRPLIVLLLTIFVNSIQKPLDYLSC